MGSWQSGGQRAEPPWGGSSGSPERCVEAFVARDTAKLPRQCRYTKTDLARVGFDLPVLAFWSYHQPIAFWRPGKRRLIELDCRDYSLVTAGHRGLVFRAARRAGIPVVCAPLPVPVTFGPHREGELSSKERWVAATYTAPHRVPGVVAARRAEQAAGARWHAKEIPYEEVIAARQNFRDLEVAAAARYAERVAKRYARVVARSRPDEVAAVTWDPTTGEFSS